MCWEQENRPGTGDRRDSGRHGSGGASPLILIFLIMFVTAVLGALSFRSVQGGLKRMEPGEALWAQTAVEKMQAVCRAYIVAEGIKQGLEPQWSEMLPDRDIWKYLVNANEGNPVQALWNRQLVESSGYKGIHTMYWDRGWKAIAPCSRPSFLGIIYHGTVDGITRVDVLIMRYGHEADKGEVIHRLQTGIYGNSRENIFMRREEI